MCDQTNNDGPSGSFVEPTTDIIRPELNLDEAKNLLKVLYGKEATEISEFVSYDDRNFFVTVPSATADDDEDGSSPPEQFVLKVLNSLGSKTPDLVRGQNALMTAAANAGTQTPRLVLNIHGEQQSLEKLHGKNHVVRLLTFLPGDILHKVPYKPRLLFQYGKFVAEIDNAIEGFKPDEGFEGNSSIWFMQSVPLLRKYLGMGFLEDWKVELVGRVVDEFERRMDAAKEKQTLKIGMIHGDCNEQNILVQESSTDPGSYEIAGVLDWGDSHRSYYIYEVAIATAYAMIDSNVVGQVEAGGHVLAGYTSTRKLSLDEWNLIPICICARLCQSLVLGAYTNLNNPDNDYVLTTQGKGWSLLRMLREASEESLFQTWSSICNQYDVQPPTL